MALRFECESSHSERVFLDALWASVTKLYGEAGASLTGLALINFDAGYKLAVIRTSLATLGVVRSSVAAITRLGGVSAAVHVLAVSGTLKALYANLE